MADKKYPTFQIVEFVDDSHVVGRNCGSDVLLGNVFTRVVRQEFTNLKSNEPQMTQTVLAEDVVIELTGIELFRRSFALLASGHTARLTLAGRDLKRLFALRSVLGDGTYIAIETPQGAQREG
jgi:hypothetical protein